MNHAIVHAKEKQISEAEELTNSLSALCENIGTNNIYGSSGQQISQVDTLFDNNRWYLISNLRQLLSQLYVEHGIVQTLVEQPVDDAYRAGFEIKTGQLSGDQIEQLAIYAERNQVVHAVMQGRKWARLYGGGGVLILYPSNPQTPINIKAIRKDTPLEFRAVDIWELYFSQQNVRAIPEVGGALGENMGDFYDYYSYRIHKSRVLRINGKEAPSFIRPRLRGWGMSELERLVRSLNQYLKNQDLVFELLDEAKVDVYKIKGFNSSLLNKTGTNGISARITLANRLKNFLNALVMDAEDDYEQKQMTFAGLAEILTQIRQGIAADLKIPMTKLFGISAAGFSSGEDDIENYNSMVDGEIRKKDKYILLDALAICCQKLFEFIPDDLDIIWNPLRVLNAKEEEEVKDSQFNRVMSSYQSGLIDDKAAKESINKDSLLGVEADVNAKAMPPLVGDFTVQGSAKGNPGKQAKSEA